MRQNHIVSMLQSGYTTVNVTYQLQAEFIEGVTKSYTFKTFLALIEGDIVVVPNDQKGFSLVKVIEVHKEPQIDLDATYDYKWIIDRVDFTTYDMVLTKEKESTEQLRKAQQYNKRKEVLEGLKNVYGEDVAQLEYNVKGGYKNDS